MSTYPTVVAGQDITADLLNSMMPQYKFKTAGTIRTNNTIADDPDLTMQLEANAIYLVEFRVVYSANTTALRCQWTVPTGATGVRNINGMEQTGTDPTASLTRWGGASFGSAAAYGDGNSVSTTVHLYEWAIVTTTNAGTCAFAWAQTATTAENTQVRAGSYMRVTRLA